MKSMLKEPFFHFVLIGVGLFILYGAVNRDFDRGDDTILITRGKIDNLTSIFTKTWQRPPTEEELNGLIDDFLREEVFYREASRIGLDDDDIIIRRRMRQKMEFIAEDLAAALQPTEQELQEYLDDNADYFRIPPRYSFRQIYIDPEKHDSNLQSYVSGLIQTLSADPTRDHCSLSDQLMIDCDYSNLTPESIERNFGSDFAQKIQTVPHQEWTGPVSSGFGQHIVIIDAHTPARMPQLEEVRETVLMEWENEKRIETLDAFYETLKSQYEIEIEAPSKETSK